jgi:ribosomal protein S15P/S13E
MARITLTTIGKSRSKSAQLAFLRQFAAGLIKHLAGKTLDLSSMIQVNDFVAKIEALLALAAAADTAEAAWKQQIEAVNTAASELGDDVEVVRSYLNALYGPKSTVLLDFGLKPQKTPVRKPAVVNAGIEKGAATRVARHTMGKKQKAAIHGEVPATAPAPATPSGPGASGSSGKSG